MQSTLARSCPFFDESRFYTRLNLVHAKDRPNPFRPLTFSIVSFSLVFAFELLVECKQQSQKGKKVQAYLLFRFSRFCWWFSTPKLVSFFQIKTWNIFFPKLFHQSFILPAYLLSLVMLSSGRQFCEDWKSQILRTGGNKATFLCLTRILNSATIFKDFSSLFSRLSKVTSCLLWGGATMIVIRVIEKLSSGNLFRLKSHHVL